MDKCTNVLFLCWTKNQFKSSILFVCIYDLTLHSKCLYEHFVCTWQTFVRELSIGYLWIDKENIVKTVCNKEFQKTKNSPYISANFPSKLTKNLLESIHSVNVQILKRQTDFVNPCTDRVQNHRKWVNKFVRFNYICCSALKMFYSIKILERFFWWCRIRTWHWRFKVSYAYQNIASR